MSILIADAGGTSIKWRLIDHHNKISQAVTEGFNAVSHDSLKLIDSLLQLKSQIELDSIENVFFYGAGILGDEKREQVCQLIKDHITTESIEVNHDLMAAARSLHGNQPGIACILGTGSNSCLYDGKNIVSNIPPLGYILGDEGSGNALGKKLLVHFLRNELPDELEKKFVKKYQVGEKEVLQKVYSQHAGPAYLAGYTKFIFHHLKHPFIYKMVYDEFDKFIEQVIIRYPSFADYTVNFCGGIAFYYANILRQVGNDRGLNIKNISEDAIAGLTLFHKSDI